MNLIFFSYSFFFFFLVFIFISLQSVLYETLQLRNGAISLARLNAFSWFEHSSQPILILPGLAVCTSGFQCDGTRCIPVDWQCDGHVDCADQTDEIECGDCAYTTTSHEPSINGHKGKELIIKDFIAKPTLHCGERRCMLASHVCDGAMDCPFGQDERNCGNSTY